MTVVYPWAQCTIEDADALAANVFGADVVTGVCLAIDGHAEEDEPGTEGQKPEKFPQSTPSDSRTFSDSGNLSVQLVKSAEASQNITRLARLVESVETEYVSVAPYTGHLSYKVVNAMVRDLEESGLDIASGNILHLSDTGDTKSPDLARTHVSDTVADFKEEAALIRDVRLENKVFRTRLLRGALEFCVNKGVEHSAAVSLTAAISAGILAINSSVSLSTPFPTESAALRRQRASVEDLRAAFVLARSGEDILSSLGEEGMLERWRVYVFGALLPPYLQLVPRVPEDYWQTLVANARELRRSLTDDVASQIGVHNRALIHLVLEENREGCEAVSYYRSDYGSGCPIEITNGSACFKPEYLKDLSRDLPPRVLQCRDSELELRSGLLSYAWSDSSELHISGYAFIPGIDVSVGEHRTWLDVVNLDTGEIAQVPATIVDNDAIDRVAGDWHQSYAASGFMATLKPADFPGVDDAGSPAPTWQVRIRRQSQGIQVTGDFTWRDRSGAAAHLDLPAVTPSGWRVVPTFSQAEGLRLIRDVPRLLVRTVVVSGRSINLSIEAADGHLARRVVARCTATNQTAHATLSAFDAITGLGEYALKIPAVPKDAKVKGEWEWTLSAESGAGSNVSLAWADTEEELERSVDPGRALTARVTGFGYLKIAERRWRILVSDCRISDDGRHLEVNGVCDLKTGHAPRLVLSNARGSIESVASELVITSAPGPARFSSKFDLRASHWGVDGLALDSGAYSLRYVPHGAEVAKSHWLLASRSLSNDLPRRTSAYRSVIEISRTEKNGAVKVFVRPRLSDFEATRYGQRTLQMRYFSGTDVDLSVPATDRAVVVECYGGRRATDTVLEMVNCIRHDYPDVPIYWGVSDESVPLPTGVQPLVIDSEEWYRHLSSARLLINNNNFPHYFRKRAGQYYLQTWHGTPLKRLVFDVDRSNFSLSYWALMAREATYWDLLVAQNPYAEKVLAEAFQYKGRVFSAGYPRNDSLLRPEARQRRSEVRDLLGISGNQKVALYAPTWRDNSKASSRQYAMVTYLDFAEFNSELGDEWTILLRGHHNVSGGRRTADLGVIDVTDYPQVNDLYLAADVLIGDYSSVMFDFHVLDKPSVFLAPDIVEYADEIRGFYFDFEQEAPGPLLATTMDVVRALRRGKMTDLQYARRRIDFQRKFAPYDDGKAAERLYRAIPVATALEGDWG